MAIITPPDIPIKIRKLELDVPGQTNRGDWTGTRQHVGQPGAETWYGKVAFMQVSREREKRLLRAFLTAMRGQQNRFRLIVAPNQRAVTDPDIAAVVNENTVTLTSATGVEVGMYCTLSAPSNGVGVGRRLVVVTATNVDSNANRISFEPATRIDPDVASFARFASPYVEMALFNPRNGWDDDEGVVTVEFDVEEF